MTTRQETIDAARLSAAHAMRTKGAVEPMIIAHIGDTLKAYPIDDTYMSSDLGKDLAVHMIGAEMRRLKADAYVFMSEAWYAPTSPDDPMAGFMPSKRPDRVEVLVVSASDREGDTVATYRTVRDVRGKFQRFDLIDNTDLEPGVTAEGRFLGVACAVSRRIY